MGAMLFLLLVSYAYIAAGLIGCLFFSFFKKKWLVFLAPLFLVVFAVIWDIGRGGLDTLIILPLLITTATWSLLIFVYRNPPQTDQRAYQFIPLMRFLIYLLTGRRKWKEKEVTEINNVLESYRKRLVADDRLSGDLTEGTHPNQKKSTRRLVDSFTSLRENKDEEDYYLQVAQHWARGMDKKIHGLSLVSIILFLLLWISGIFLAQYIDGIMVFVFLFGFVFFPIIGLVLALMGRGWKKWLLAAINVLAMIVAVMIIL
ncbi:hypothetical protein HUG15_05940 [Salicibibacter cibarius]|uniref:Uncharacterized protein n=1 Tax=Salicibibacter cibarius TaxID=2743000 RepID=A0A7T7CAR8_9BACI|nr:hypothetical protein [Salicibibacter cibarius]QQK75194.1 hypothetical protein HUG15_05940 [Salicibibacter cibarius]